MLVGKKTNHTAPLTGIKYSLEYFAGVLPGSEMISHGSTGEMLDLCILTIDGVNKKFQYPLYPEFKQGLKKYIRNNLSGYSLLSKKCFTLEEYAQMCLDDYHEFMHDYKKLRKN